MNTKCPNCNSDTDTHEARNGEGVVVVKEVICTRCDWGMVVDLAVPKPKSYSVIYYTAHKPHDKLAEAVRQSIEDAMSPEAELICVSWFPVKWERASTLIVTGERPPEMGGHENQFKQMLYGLQAATNDVCFLAEDDVLYPGGAWDWYTGINQPQDSALAYNLNVWRMNEIGAWPTPQMVDSCCAGIKRILIEACQFKLAQIARGERIKWSELGKETPCDELVTLCKAQHPTIDIRWGGNLTGRREAPQGGNRIELPYWGSHAALCERVGIEANQENQA
jgi:hypothetical protein